jgi:uncharacterized membrane protein
MITQVSNTISTLKNLWIELFLDKTNKVTNVADGSVLNAVAFGTAKVAQKAIKDIAITEAKIFPETATGEYLDKSAALFGVSPRKGALGSSTYVRVYADPGTIYNETNFFVNQNGIRFSVNESVTVGRSGYAYVSVRSVNQGLVTNVDANSIINVTPAPSGHIECTNEYMATGGRDSEDDETFRIRIMTNLNTLSKGTLEYYTQIFQNIDDRILKVLNVGLGEDGIFYLYLVSQNGILFTQDELETLLEKSKSYFGLFELNLEGNVVGIQLKNAEWFFIGSERGMDFRIEIDPSYDVATVRKNIQVALTKYLDFRFWEAGKIVQWDDLLGIVKNAEGVKYVPDEYFFPYYDQEVPLNQLPRIKGFVMRNLEGIVLYDAGSELSPMFYPAGQEDLFQGLNDSALALRQPVYFSITDEDGNPLSGVRISVGSGSVVTDEDGLATISLVNGNYIYTASKEKYKQQQGQFVVLNAPVYIGIILELAPFQISFMVEDQFGVPVVDATISIAGQSLTTNVNGEATVLVKNGTYPYTVEKLGFDSNEGSSVTVDNSDVYVPVTLYYHKWVQTIFVKGLNSENFISGVLIEIGSDSYVTDDDGKVQVSLINGSYLAKFSKPGYVDTQALIVVLNQDETRTIEMDLYKYNVTIKVIELVSGKVIPDALITLDNGLVARTNSNGLVVFRLTNGEYTGTITNPIYDDLTINFNIDTSDADFVYQLDFRHYDVFITVVDSKNNPIQDALVSISDQVLVTDEGGKVQIGLQNGTYPYKVEKLGYYNFSGSVLVKDNDVSVVAKMVDYPWSITFSVKDGNTPIQGAVININGQQYSTGQDGLVKLTLVNGSYDYTVTKIGYVDVDRTLVVNNSNVSVDVPMVLRPWNVIFSVTSEGVPVEGASITVEGITVETNAGGIAVIGLVNGIHQYEISATEFQTKTGSVTVSNSDTSVQVSLDPVTYPITFVVRDKTTPTPALVQDAVVSAKGQSVLTNASGEAVLQLPKGDFEVSITKQNYISTTTQITVTGIDTINVQIDRIYLLDFTVTGEQGTILSGAKVVVSGEAIVLPAGQSSIELTTNDAGRTPQVQTINGSFHWGASFSDYSSSEGDDTIANANKTVAISLKRGKRAVFTVTDGTNPLQGVNILIDNVTNYQTNVDGQVDISLSAGNHTYKASLTSYQTISGTINVKEDETSYVNLTMVHGGLLTLNVKNGVANLSGATVVIKNSSGTTVKSGTTDSNGNISVDVPNGNYTYTTDASGYKQQPGSTTISSADKTVQVQMQNYKYWGVTFNVKYKTTNLNGAAVSISNVKTIGGTSTANGTTNSSGQWILAASAKNDATLNGTVSWTASLSGYRSASGSFNIANANQTINVTLEKYSTVTLTFVNYAGTALSGISVTMNNQTVTTNASGQAIFSNVIDGTYNWSSTAKSPYQAKSGSVTVNGANVNQQITLTSQVTVTFVAKDDAGTALSGATVKVAGVSKGTTNSSGQLAVTMQSQSAAYACTVELSGYQTWSGNVTVGLSAQTVNASLQYLVTFTATIKENTTSGANVGSATVKLVNSSLGTFTGTTNSSGVATIPNVKPGSYTYTISKSGYKDTTGSVTVSRSSHSQSATYALLRYYTFVVNVKRAGVNRNGVTVKLDGTSKGTTNSSGNITISNVLYGSHTIAIDAGTYWKAFSQSYTISSTSTINIALTALYTAQFTISDANGPISGAKITLTGIATGTLTTNTSGIASKTGIVAGTLSYSVSAAGYMTKTGTVTLSGSNDSINTSITLQKAAKLVQITTPLDTETAINIESGFSKLEWCLIQAGAGGGGGNVRYPGGGGGAGSTILGELLTLSDGGTYTGGYIIRSGGAGGQGKNSTAPGGIGNKPDTANIYFRKNGSYVYNVLHRFNGHGGSGASRIERGSAGGLGDGVPNTTGIKLGIGGGGGGGSEGETDFTAGGVGGEGGAVYYNGTTYNGGKGYNPSNISVPNGGGGGSGASSINIGKNAVNYIGAASVSVPNDFEKYGITESGEGGMGGKIGSGGCSSISEYGNGGKGGAIGENGYSGVQGVLFIYFF